MSIVVARVPTHSASRYLQQLAKHWSHKLEVTFSEQEARISFPNGATLDLRADSETLDVRLAVTADGEMERMKEVVASHLNRFAFREAPLIFDWQAV